MVCIIAKDRHLRMAAIAVICGPLLATLCFGIPQMSKPEKSDGAQKRMTIVVHITDQNGNPVVPGSVKDVQVLEHGKKLQVVDGPKSAGPKQIALLLDSNFHQRKVLPLEQQTAVRTPL